MNFVIPVLLTLVLIIAALIAIILCMSGAHEDARTEDDFASAEAGNH
jgi:hypothetical protein